MEQALTLLASGMITIFVILSLVVLLGNGLIRLVNRWAPQAPPAVLNSPDSNNLHPETVSAIVAAVDLITQGKGRVVSIEKAEDR